MPQKPEERAAHYYRKQAADARARADQMLDSRDRESLLDVAAGWDRLADLETKNVLPQSD